MDRIQLLSLLLALAFLLIVLGFIRKQRFRERQAFQWLMLAGAGVFIAAALPLLNGAARRIGIAYMPAFVFVLAFFVVLILLMLQAASFSALQEKVKSMAQEMAALRLELEDSRQPSANGPDRAEPDTAFRPKPNQPEGGVHS